MELTESLFYALEIVGTIAFAISGAMTAIERDMDLFGVLFLGLISAVGGGAVRDVLIGCFPPRMFVTMDYVLVAVLAAGLVFLAAYFAGGTYFKSVKRIDMVNNIFDALGLGVFSVSGTAIGLTAGFGENGFFCISLGLITGIGGGLLRDMMSRSIPLVLRRRIYALAALAGALVFFVLTRWGADHAVAAFSGIGATGLIRLLATHFEWNLPVAAPERTGIRRLKAGKEKKAPAYRRKSD